MAASYDTATEALRKYVMPLEPTLRYCRSNCTPWSILVASPNPPAVDNLHLVKLEEIPDLLRWIEVSRPHGLQ
jgi:hypothetical protein